MNLVPPIISCHETNNFDVVLCSPSQHILATPLLSLTDHCVHLAITQGHELMEHKLYNRPINNLTDLQRVTGEKKSFNLLFQNA